MAELVLKNSAIRISDLHHPWPSRFQRPDTISHLSVLAYGRGLPLSSASPPPRSAHTKRESTDEHNTDAPSIHRRGSAAATDATGSFERTGTHPSNCPGTAAARGARSGRCPAAARAEAEGGRETAQKGGGQAPETEGESEGEEAQREGGGSPRCQRPRQEEGQEGTAVSEEEALSRLRAMHDIARERPQLRIRARFGSYGAPAARVAGTIFPNDSIS